MMGIDEQYEAYLDKQQELTDAEIAAIEDDPILNCEKCPYQNEDGDCLDLDDECCVLQARLIAYLEGWL